MFYLIDSDINQLFSSIRLNKTEWTKHDTYFYKSVPEYKISYYPNGNTECSTTSNWTCVLYVPSISINRFNLDHSSIVYICPPYVINENCNKEPHFNVICTISEPVATSLLRKHGKISNNKDTTFKLDAFLKKLRTHTIDHSDKTLYEHLMNTYITLYSCTLDETIALIGGLHSLYGTAYFKKNVLDKKRCDN
jgi:hypothetical protein